MYLYIYICVAACGYVCMFGYRAWCFQDLKYKRSRNLRTFCIQSCDAIYVYRHSIQKHLHIYIYIVDVNIYIYNYKCMLGQTYLHLDRPVICIRTYIYIDIARTKHMPEIHRYIYIYI